MTVSEDTPPLGPHIMLLETSADAGFERGEMGGRFAALRSLIALPASYAKIGGNLATMSTKRRNI